MAPFKDAVTSLALDGSTIFAGSVDGTVRSFDIRLGAQCSGRCRESERRESAGNTLACANSITRCVCVPCVTAPLRRRRVCPGTSTTDDLGAPVTSIRLTADGNCILAATIGAGIRLIDRAYGTHLADFSGHACAAFLQSPRILRLLLCAGRHPGR